MVKKCSSGGNRWDVIRHAATAGWGTTLRVCLIVFCFGITSTTVLVAATKVISYLLSSR
jgi:hypothetical protein